MKNAEINSKFSDWLLNPRETLDFEVKGWLDLNEKENQATLAKALIALENHGGGFLLLGYEESTEKIQPCKEKRPVSLDIYLNDNINNIIKRYADPTFHVDVTLQPNKEDGLDYPLLRVSGKSKVPIRSTRSSEKNSISQNKYYIRAPGPESREPLTPAEWDTLLKRTLLNQKEEIINTLRLFYDTTISSSFTTEQSESEKLSNFIEKCVKKWKGQNESLPETHKSKIKKGYFIQAAKIIGTSKHRTLKEIKDFNYQSRNYSGWPPFASIFDPANQTSAVVSHNGIEAWLAALPTSNVRTANFWRIEEDGNFFLLSGYGEDTDSPWYRYGREPGKMFEARLPIWDTGEFILKILEIGSYMYEGDFQVIIQCEWTGLADRTLFISNGRRFIPSHHKCTDQEIKASSQHTKTEIETMLPEVVRNLTKKLYEHFNFFSPENNMYVTEIENLKTGNM